MKYQQLTEGHWYQIALLYGERFSCRDIGLRGGVNKSTVSRELRRNCTPDGYAPNEAQRLSESDVTGRPSAQSVKARLILLS